MLTSPDRASSVTRVNAVHSSLSALLLLACSPRDPMPTVGDEPPAPRDREEVADPATTSHEAFRVRCFEGDDGSLCLLQVDGYLIDRAMRFVPLCEETLAGAEELATWPAEVQSGDHRRALTCGVGEPLPDGVRCWRFANADVPRCHVAGAGFLSATMMGHDGPLPTCMRDELVVSEKDALAAALARLREAGPPNEAELASVRRLRPEVTAEDLRREHQERIEELTVTIARLEDGSLASAEPCETASRFVSCSALGTIHTHLGGEAFVLAGGAPAHPADAYVGQLLSEGMHERSGWPRELRCTTAPFGAHGS